MGKRVKFAAASCFHCPYENRPAFDKLLGVLEDFKPEVFVLLGDLFEAEAASVHPHEESIDVLDEYRAAGEVLVSIRKQLGKRTRLIWLLGNHDDNLQAADPRRVPKNLRKSVHWNRDIDWAPEFRRWQQFPYVKNRSGVFELGQVIFTHGWDAGLRSDYTEALQMADLCGGYSHRLVVRGHTHRPRDVEQIRYSINVPLPFWVTNVGTMGPLKPGYMLRKDTSQWGPAVLIGEADSSRPSYRLSGRQWDADLVAL